MNKWFNPLILGVLALTSATGYAGQALSLMDVMRSSYHYHPKIQQSLAKVSEAQGGILASEGAFDWQLNNNSMSRTQGYYDGWHMEQKITRYLGDYNAKVSAGYRVSDGSLPVYESQHLTQSGGEANIGLQLSLLRDRETDKYRTGINNARLEEKYYTQALNQGVNEVLYKAGLAYLDWYASYRQVEVAKQLLALAQNRQEAIRQKVASGELAKIALTEFERERLKRKGALLSARQGLQDTELRLRLYWRDTQGQLQVSGTPHTPAVLPQAMVQHAFDERWLARSLEQHPRLHAWEQKLAMTKNKLRLSHNQYLPRLDLELKLAQDMGTGSETLDGVESYVGLKFSMPLERRKARGEILQYESKLRALELEGQQLKESLDNQLQIARASLNNLKEIMQLKQSEADIAARLMEQEQARFALGESDFFLLNLREAQGGKATLDAVKARLDSLKQEMQLLALSGQLASLFNRS